MREVLTSLIARGLSFLPIALATLAASYIVIDAFGLVVFSTFQIVLAAGFIIIAMSDFGVGAAVTSALARRQDGDPASPLVLVTALRTLGAVALVVELANLGIALFVGWPAVLGELAATTTQVSVAVALLGLSIPLGLGRSVMLGLGRNHQTVAFHTAFMPIVLVGVLLCAYSGVDEGWVVVTPAAAAVLCQGALFTFALRSGRFSIRQLSPLVVAWRRVKGAPIWQSSLPMFLISVTSAFLVQSDRLVLNHVSDAAEVARYALASQLFMPLLALITAAAAPLWPIYERARGGGDAGPRLLPIITVFAVGTAVMCVPLLAWGDHVVDLVSGSQAGLGLGLGLAFSAFLVVEAVAVPVAMSRMDVRGLRYFSGFCLASIPPKLVLSILFASWWGAPGPLVASIVTVALLQLVPLLWIWRFRPPLPVPA